MSATPQRATKKNLRIVVALLVLVASLSVAVIAGVRLYSAQQTYRQAQDAYGQLQVHVESGAASIQSGSETPAFPLNVDFAALHEVNPDITAWLYSPGTPINYPVLAGEDYDYYLHHLPDGSENFLGSLFTDFNHAPDFSGKLNIIYGHHSQNDDMFAPLLGYESQEYYNTHSTMYLATQDGKNFQVEVLYGAHIRAGQWRERAFMYEENLPSLLTYAKANTTFTPDCVQDGGGGPSAEAVARGVVADAETPTRYLVLSTCSYQFDNARYIVVAALVPAGEQVPGACPLP